MAKQSQDFTAIFKDMMGAFPVDTKSMEGMYMTAASMNEKMAHVALDAAEKSTEIGSKWTMETISRMGELSKAKSEPADYAKAMTDFASAQAETAAEHMAAFAEIAKKVQMETVELMMAAGKEMSEDAQKTMKKVSDDMAAATKKAQTEMSAAAKKAAKA